MGEVNPERVAIHAPFGRDAEMIAKVLSQSGITAKVCATIEDLRSELQAGVGSVVVTDEAFGVDDIERLSAALHQQESWSDLPVLVFTGRGETTDLTRHRLKLLQRLGNVVLLERPLRPETLVSRVEAALRARRHQYRIRDLLDTEHRSIAALQESSTKLREANAQLAAANGELEEFAYISSHDLQEPLRMVGIYTEMLVRKLEPHLDADASQYADFAQKGVQRMEALLRDLLEFSRLVQTTEERKRTANLAEALSAALSTMQTRIQETNAKIIHNGLPSVVGDQSQLSQVFQNLISNSLKYRKTDQPPEIRITAQPEGSEWRISVADNGIGFEPRHAETIFGLFKRLHRENYPGTGLGLAICKRIIERHGGRIWAESEPNRGAKINFVLQGRESA